jgi:hypothetical protein
MKRQRLFKKKKKEDKERMVVQKQKFKDMKVDMKWLAVCRFFAFSTSFSPPHIKVQHWICQESGLKSIRVLQNIVKKVYKEGLWRKKRKLRSRPKFDLVNKIMKKIYTTFRGELSQLTITELCHQHGVLCSSQTIHRVFFSPLWKCIKRSLALTNTP